MTGQSFKKFIQTMTKFKIHFMQIENRVTDVLKNF